MSRHEVKKVQFAASRAKILSWFFIIPMLLTMSTGILGAEEIHSGDQDNIDSIKRELRKIKTETNMQSRDLEKQKVNLSNLEGKVNELKAANQRLNEDVAGLHKNLLDSLYTSEKKVLVDVYFNRQKMKTISLLGLLLLLGLTFLLALSWLQQKKKLKNSTERMYRDIRETRQHLEEESIKLDSKLLDLADKQLEIINKQPPSAESEKEIDHTLTLKIADEVIRIQMNLLNIDPTIKGYKQLIRAAESIMDNLNANGYEIPQLLNKKYDGRMKAIVTMILDENLSAGERIIRRILKPQVNFQGSMIQAAELVVAFND